MDWTVATLVLPPLTLAAPTGVVAAEPGKVALASVEDARLRIHAEVIANWAQLQAAASEIQL